MLRGEIFMLTEFVNEYPEMESDGATRLAQVVLHERKVQYKTYTGYVEHVSTGEIVQPHFWLTVGKFTVDFRLRRYLGPLLISLHGSMYTLLWVYLVTC